MLTRLSGQGRSLAAILSYPCVPYRGIVHSASLDNTNRLEDGGVAAMSPAFIENKLSMDVAVNLLQQLLSQAAMGGGQPAIERHKSRGKLMPRDRISALLDPGSPFLELSQLAGHQLYGKSGYCIT